MRNPIFAGSALLLVLIGGNAGAGSFTSLDDAQFGYLTALSHNGRIATGTFTAGGMFAGAFVWRKGVGLETIPFYSSQAMTSWAQPIAGSADDGNGNSVAALGYSDLDTTGPVIIGPFPGSTPLDNFYSQAYGISDNGVVVGLAYDPSPNPIAFRWTAAEGMTRLAVNRPDTFSRANAISTDGNTIVGWNDQETGYRQAVIWIQGKPVEPHNFGMYGDAFGSPPGEALAVNANGTVVVGLGFYDDLMQSQAWRWTAATDAQPIGVILPPPAPPAIAAMLARLQSPAGAFADAHYNPDGFFVLPQSNAVAVSADGNTIVGNTGDGQTEQAFIWTAQGGMVLMSDYAAAHGIDVPEGFYLLSANALSADTKTIGGIGIDPTGSYVASWIMDLHDAPTHDTVVMAQGSVVSNDLDNGPFSGYPAGAAISMAFHVDPAGNVITPGRESSYPVDAGSFQITARYTDPNDFSHHFASESLDAASSPLFHLVNDNPRRDGVDLPATPVATTGQTIEFSLSNPGGTLFDSDEATLINRSFGPSLFDSAIWRISDGTHSMNISLQWMTIKDDTNSIFSDGFDGG